MRGAWSDFIRGASSSNGITCGCMVKSVITPLDGECGGSSVVGIAVVVIISTLSGAADSCSPSSSLGTYMAAMPNNAEKD